MAKTLNRNLVGGLTLAVMLVLAGAGLLLISNLPGRDPKVYEDQAKKHEEKQEWSQATQAYARAYQRDPEHNPEYLVMAAKAALEEGAIGAVRDLTAQARVKDPQLKSASKLLTEFEFELAKQFPSNLQWNRVLNEAKKLVGIDKDSAIGHFALGQAYLTLQKENPNYRQQGEESLKRALELDPGNSEVVELLAREQWASAIEKERAGQKDLAENIENATNSMVASMVEKCPPDRPKDYNRLRRLQAFYHLLKGDFDKSIASLKELAAKDSSVTDTYLFLGNLLSGTSIFGGRADLAESETYLQKALAIDPKDGRVYQSLAQVYKSMRSQEKDADKRLAVAKKEEDLYRKGLETIPKTKHFRELKNNVSRVFFFTELFLLDMDRVIATENKATKDEALASAASWLDKLKQEVSADSLEVRYLTANLLHAKGDVIAATKEAEAANRITGSGENVRLQALLSELYARQGQWGAASKALKKALEIVPSSAMLKLRLGQVYLQMNEPTLALAELKPSEPGPLRDYLLNDENAIQLRMEAYRQLNQTELASEEAKKLASGTSGDELRDARLLMTEQRYNEAEAKIKPILAANSANETAARMLFRVYEATDRFGDAKALVDDLLSSHPDNRTYLQFKYTLLESEKDDAALLEFLNKEKDPYIRAIGLSDYYARRENFVEAMRQCDEAEKAKPTNPEVIDRQLRLAAAAKDWDRMTKYVKRDTELNADGTEGKIAAGRMAYAQGRYQEAVDLISAGLTKYGSSSIGWTYLAEAYLAMNNRIAEAKNAISKALESDPTNGFANRAMAQLLLSEGLDKDAEKYVMAASRAMPDDQWLRRQKQIIREKENPSTGIAARERARRDSPDDLENLVLLARLYSDSKVAQYDKASEVYRQALKVSKNDLRLLREVARFFGREEVNRPQEGNDLLLEIMNQEQDKPRKAEVAVCLGQFFEVQKTLASADRYFRLAVSLDPSNDVLNSAGEYYARTNRYRDAVQYYSRLLKQATKPEDAALAQTTHSRIVALWLAIGDLDNAKTEIDAFAAKYPNDTQGMIFKGAYHRIGGDIQKAKEAFDTHLEKDASNAVALWQRGQMYMLMGKWQLALDDLRKSKTFSPDGFLYQHRIALADTLMELGRGDEAVVELKSILDQKPDQTGVAVALIDAYARVKPPRYSDAENVILSYMRMYPKDPQWPTLLGRLGERMQKWDKAIQGYEKASELSRENRDLIISLFNAYKRADRPKSMTDYLAEKLSERQLERMPLQLASLGWAYFKIGQKEKGLESFDRALLAAADDFVAYTTVIGEIVSVIGLKDALERAKQEVARDPNNIEKQKSLVHLYQYDKNPEEALKAATRVAELAAREKDVIFAHLAQGMLLEQSDRRPEAKPHYEAALKIDAKQPIALNNMAFLLAEGMNNPSEALPYAQQAVRSDPNNADWLDTLGYVLMLNGRTGEAMGALLRAKEIERENPTILLHLGQCLIKRGEKEEAQQWLRKAKEVAEKKGDRRVLPKIEKALTEAS